MATHLTNMAIDKVSLVDKGANGRRFAILKADSDAWLPDALADMDATVRAALATEDAELTPEVRIRAVKNEADRFLAAVADRVAARYGVEKASPLRGVLTGPSPRPPGRVRKARGPLSGIL